MHCRTGAGPSAIATEHATAVPRKRAPPLGERGSGHHAQSTDAAVTLASTSAHPPLTATAAPGSCASPPATHAATPSTEAAACAPRPPTAGRALPVTAPANPASIATDTSGPAMMFATGARSETIPKPDATTGTVVNCATSVSDSACPIRRDQPDRPAVAHAPARSPNTRRPPTASAESCSPRSKTAQGALTSTATTAAASEAIPSPRRPASCPAPPTTSMSSERIAEYGSPVTTAYAAPATTVATTSGRRGTCNIVPMKATAAHAAAR